MPTAVAASCSCSTKQAPFAHRYCCASFGRSFVLELLNIFELVPALAKKQQQMIRACLRTTSLGLNYTWDDTRKLLVWQRYSLASLVNACLLTSNVFEKVEIQETQVQN